MQRVLEGYLKQWAIKPNRKPLILRGARQVGKTHLIRMFGRANFDHFLEINFDESPNKANFFETDNLDQLIQFLSLDTGVPVIPGKTLIFLDEVQLAPKAIAKLRYFFERKNNIHIIAAGSLLDFVLADFPYSMPVGRIEYLFMGPMDFIEFLNAHGKHELTSFIESYCIGETFPTPIHDQLKSWLQRYLAIGGMPGAVFQSTKSQSLVQVQQELASIIQTYQDDFAKYKKRIHAGRLKMVLEKLPSLMGTKVKYVNISPHEKAKDINDSLEMLQMARIIHKIHHSAGNNIPLRSEKKENDFKIVFLDIGLALRSLNLNIASMIQESSVLSNKGGIAEQFIGQQWLCRQYTYQEPELFYWNRQNRGSSAELDYLFEIDGSIVPIEVKSGSTGSLKSLQIFTKEKGVPRAIRYNLDLPSIYKSQSKNHKYKLLSLPLYMISQTERIYRGL